MVDFSLTKEQIDLQSRTRDFAQEYMIPYAHYYDKTGEFPLPIIRKCWEAGLMNLAIPKEYGGLGLGAVEQCIAVEELAAGCAGMTTSIYVNSLGAEPILIAGNKEQKEKYLRPLTEDLRFVSFACSEPGMGSDVAGIKTRVEKEGDHYILNGSKFWITNAPHADYFTVFASLDPSQRHKALCAFIVDADTPGVKTGRPVEKMGHRASTTSSVMFRDAKVPAENLLGEEGKGLRVSMAAISDVGRGGMVGCALGLQAACLEASVKFANERILYGRPISKLQGIQNKLAEMKIDLEAGRLLAYRAAAIQDQGIRCDKEFAVAKYFTTEAAQKAAKLAIDIHGGYGCLEEFAVTRYLRDAFILGPSAGTSDIMKIIIARWVLS